MANVGTEPNRSVLAGVEPKRLVLLGRGAPPKRLAPVAADGTPNRLRVGAEALSPKKDTFGVLVPVLEAGDVELPKRGTAGPVGRLGPAKKVGPYSDGSAGVGAGAGVGGTLVGLGSSLVRGAGAGVAVVAGTRSASGGKVKTLGRGCSLPEAVGGVGVGCQAGPVDASGGGLAPLAVALPAAVAAQVALVLDLAPACVVGSSYFLVMLGAEKGPAGVRALAVAPGARHAAKTPDGVAETVVAWYACSAALSVACGASTFGRVDALAVDELLPRADVLAKGDSSCPTAGKVTFLPGGVANLENAEPAGGGRRSSTTAGGAVVPMPNARGRLGEAYDAQWGLV